MTALDVTHALELRRLRTLQRVATLGSFSRAADELHFTQSAVSQQIAALERDLGLPLVHRHPVMLTEAGRVLCRRYECALAELTAANAELDALRSGGSGNLRIASPASPIARILPRAVAGFAARLPQVRIDVCQRAGTGPVDALVQGEADLALTFRQPQAVRPALRSVRVAHERIGVITPAGHPLADRGSTRLGDLAAWQLLDWDESPLPGDELASRTGEDVATAVHFAGESVDALHELIAAADDGYAFAGEFDRRDSHRVAWTPVVDPPLVRSLYAAVLEAAAANATVETMLAEVVTAARRPRAPVPERQARIAA